LRPQVSPESRAHTRRDSPWSGAIRQIPTNRSAPFSRAKKSRKDNQSLEFRGASEPTQGPRIKCSRLHNHMENRRATIKKLTIRELLKPHVKALTIGFIAVVGEGVANLLEPWPLKIVLDSVLRSRPTHGWLNQFIQSTVGGDKFAILKFACAAVLGIAVLDAISSYTEKYFTTSVGQWVTHDLRRTLYSRIQQLSLAYHDQKRSGDLLSRVTSDIDAIQSFINTALLGALINLITLVGMIGVMLYLNWRFTLIALSVAPGPLLGRFQLHAPYQKGFQRSSQERRRNCFSYRRSAVFDPCGQGVCTGGL
jgi:ABC-type multidrug transport system fused ATPase/permease subunit